MRRFAAGLACGAFLFTGVAAGHEVTGQADYTLPVQNLLNDHFCHEDEYKFISSSGDRVRCVPKDGGFPRLAPHE